MVVSQNKKDPKLGNKSGSNHVVDLRFATGHVISKETLGSRSSNNVVGPSRMSKNEVIRKSQFESSLNQANAKEAVSMRSGHDGFEYQGRFSHRSAKGKPNANSVKGKKEFANSRALHFNSPQSGRSKEVNKNSIKWTLSINSS